MPERTLVVDHLKFSYEGVFSAAELYEIISSFFFEKGWDWYEKINQEQITPEGKQMHIIFEPWKNVSDYYKLTTRIVFNLTDIKDIEVEHDGKQIKLDHGLVKITFDGYVNSDRKKKWTKPFYWLLSMIMEKYFFRQHFTKFEDWIKSDLDDLLHKIKTYLNVCKYSYQT